MDIPVKQEIPTAGLQPDWGDLDAVAAILACGRTTAWEHLNEWRGRGLIGKLHRKFHLDTVRRLAIAASMEGNS